MKRHTTQSLSVQVLNVPIIKDRKKVKRVPEFVAYLFWFLHEKYGATDVCLHHLRIASKQRYLVFIIKQEYGGGWCTCSYDPEADAYDLQYGQDKERQEPLITVSSGHYAHGVRQSRPMQGTIPELYLSSVHIEGKFLLDGINAMFFADKIKLSINRELAAYRPRALKIKLPTYESVEY